MLPQVGDASGQPAAEQAAQQEVLGAWPVVRDDASVAREHGHRVPFIQVGRAITSTHASTVFAGES